MSEVKRLVRYHRASLSERRDCLSFDLARSLFLWQTRDERAVESEVEAFPVQLQDRT
jgi:hypothetical protein